MRVLEVVAYPRLSRGTAIQAATLASDLARRGHEVECVFADEPRNRADNLATLAPLQRAGVGLDLLQMDHPTAPVRLRRLIRRGAFDVIHAHYRDTALRLVLRAATAMKSPALVASWGNTYPIDRHRWLPRGLRRRGERCSFDRFTGAALRSARVRAITAVSYAAKDVLSDAGVERAKVQVIYEGVDPAVFHPGVSGQPVRRELGIPADRPVVGMVCANYWVRDIPTFLGAAAQVASRRPSVAFLLVGDGIESLELPGHALDGRLVRSGARGDVASVLASIDVVVSTSLYDGLSGVMREALAMAKPVVCTDVGGNPEIVRHDQTGLLFRPGDRDALARGILRALDDPARATERGAQGRELILAGHTRERRAELTEALYEALVN